MPGKQFGVSVVFDARNLAINTYTDTIKITSNATNQPLLYVPVTLSVTEGVTTMSGIVRDLTVQGIYLDSFGLRNASVELLLNGNVVAGPVQTNESGYYFLQNIPILPNDTYTLHVYKVIELPKPLPINKALDTIHIYRDLTINSEGNRADVTLPVSLIEKLYSTISFLSDLKFYLVRWDDVIPSLDLIKDYRQDGLQKIVDTLLTKNVNKEKREAILRTILAQKLFEEAYLIYDTVGGICYVSIGEAGIGIASLILKISTGGAPWWIELLVRSIEGIFEELLSTVKPSAGRDVIINGIAGMVKDILEGSGSVSFKDFLLSFIPTFLQFLGYPAMEEYVFLTEPSLLKIPNYGGKLEYSGTFWDAYPQYKHRVNRYCTRKMIAWDIFENVGDIGDIFDRIKELMEESNFERWWKLFAEISDFITGNIITSIAACGSAVYTGMEILGPPPIFKYSIHQGPDSIFHPSGSVIAGNSQKYEELLKIQNESFISYGIKEGNFSFVTDLDNTVNEYLSVLDNLSSWVQTNKLEKIKTYETEIEQKNKNLNEAIKERESVINAFIQSLEDVPEGLANIEGEYRKGIVKFYGSAMKLVALIELFLQNPAEYKEELNSVINTHREIISNIKPLIEEVLKNIPQTPISNLFMLSPISISSKPIEVLPGEEFTISAKFSNPLPYPVENINISLSYDTLKISIQENPSIPSGKIAPAETIVFKWKAKVKENASGFSAFSTSSEIKISNGSIGKLSITSGVYIRGKDEEKTPSTGGRLSSKTAYAYPSPFNPKRGNTFIRFSLAKDAKVTIKIYDSGNNLVTTLLKDTPMKAKVEQRVVWNGRNDYGEIVANGVYFIVIETDKRERAVVKVAVLR